MTKRKVSTILFSVGAIIGELLATLGDHNFDGVTSGAMIVAYIIAALFMPDREPKQ